MMTIFVEEKELLATAVEAAKTGGKILMDWRKKFTVREKSRSNLVTEADFASQEAVEALIKSKYPEHGFLGEETPEEESNSDYRWIVDPLDGTSNYVHGFPFFAVSIGVEYKGELIVGVVYDPNQEEMFTASFSGGAFVNDEPISASEIDEMPFAMAVASLPVDSDAKNPAVARFLNVLPHVQTVQRTGSAALNLAYVACGRIEAFWSSSLKPWDMAAGVVLVRAAGGSVTKMDGQTFEVESPDLLSSNGTAVHQGIQKILMES